MDVELFDGGLQSVDGLLVFNAFFFGHGNVKAFDGTAATNDGRKADKDIVIVVVVRYRKDTTLVV